MKTLLAIAATLGAGVAFVLALALPLSLGGAAHAAETRALLLLERIDVPRTRALVAQLAADGARVEQVVPGRAIIARFPDSAPSAAALAGVRDLTVEGATPEISLDADPLLRGIVGAWEQMTGIATAGDRATSAAHAQGTHGARGAPATPPAPTRTPLGSDAAFPPLGEAPAGRSLAAPPGAGFFDTSEFMLGSITVAVLLPESDGSIDPNQEDWTPAEEAAVTAEIMNGMAWWTARAADIGHTLTFWFDFRFGLTQGYEPITRPSGANALWIPPIMTSLGYTAFASRFDNVRDFLNDERDAFGTDWADAMFVIDDTVDPDDNFASGFFAFSYFGGPFLWMTYGNAGWGIDNMDMLAAHELGHQYYAFDEYASSGCTCTEQMGYLLGKNQNCDAACTSNIPSCIMRSGTAPITANVVEFNTAKQIGLLDADGDGIPNILDTAPQTALDPFGADTTADATPTYTGSGAAIPKPNLNTAGQRNDITLNVVSLVEFRVDAGAWTPATPADGAFDDSLEAFTFTTAPLAAGSHIVEARAVHSYGNADTTAAADTIVIVNSPVSITPAEPLGFAKLSAGPSPTAGGVVIRFGLREPARARVAVFGADGRRVAALEDRAFATGPHEIAWDGVLESRKRAPAGVYFVRLETPERSESARVVLVR